MLLAYKVATIKGFNNILFIPNITSLILLVILILLDIIT